jgi:hypothetical protein
MWAQRIDDPLLIVVVLVSLAMLACYLSALREG